MKAAARSFVDALRKEDRLAVLRFSDKAEVAHDLTLFRTEALKAIDEYTSHGGTALYDAVHEALGRLQTRRGPARRRGDDRRPRRERRRQRPRAAS